MKCFAQFVIPLAVLVLLASSRGHAQTVVSIYKQPPGVVSIGETQFVPCANRGQGEWIDLFGPEAVQVIYITYRDGSSRTKLFARVDFKATGESTGLTYESKATILQTFLGAPGQTSGTNQVKENFIIAAGNGINFHYHENITFSWTIDPVTYHCLSREHFSGVQLDSSYRLSKGNVFSAGAEVIPALGLPSWGGFPLVQSIRSEPPRSGAYSGNWSSS
jgi:hypothetical protein